MFARHLPADDAPGEDVDDETPWEIGTDEQRTGSEPEANRQRPATNRRGTGEEPAAADAVRTDRREHRTTRDGEGRPAQWEVTPIAISPVGPEQVEAHGVCRLVPPTRAVQRGKRAQTGSQTDQTGPISDRNGPPPSYRAPLRRELRGPLC